MSIKDVLYRAVHAYPGGVAALAARMGKNPNTLQSKINPNLGTHHTTAEELEQIQTFTNTDEIAKYLAAQRGMICIPVVRHEGASDTEILDLVIQMNTAESGFLSEMQRALADGGVCEKEMAVIRNKAHEHMAAIAELVSRIEGMVR
ncbi:Phage regulatory protein CII (CP76) [Nitrosospira multiformis]|uniref:Phage regulatory protein CII (CP76) n=1 Tax=Nitrosospira multiformis TaxID=1231 RepID=A0A1H8IU95_9PROT|nr:phage regulatory CII family protein [Nitrosospira multiformis]SEN72032.1 Phage regulatory protein CII (CP76) [Nitrosospira multiformis]